MTHHSVSQVAEAYEVLSDSNARKEYDRSGVKQGDKAKGNNNNRGNQRQQPFWDFFGRRNQQQHHDPLQHHLYRRHDVRQQVHAAQRRVSRRRDGLLDYSRLLEDLTKRPYAYIPCVLPSYCVITAITSSAIHSISCIGS